MSDDFAIVDYTDVEAEPFTESAVEHRKLTDHLGATEMRVNAVELDPGEVLDPHAHERQEEIYVAVTAGQVAIEGEIHDIPRGASSGSVPTRSADSVTTPMRPTFGCCSVRRRSAQSRTSAST
jgi:uncharacterized cupin superfamily protein